MLGAAKPTRAQLVAEIGDVVHDLPAFATAPLFRRRHLRWGATPAELKPDSTWAWRLTSNDGTSTRLVTRIHAVYDWRHPATALFGAILIEFGDFAMQRRMLRGIKVRAESGTS